MPDLELGTVLEEEREQLESLSQQKKDKVQQKDVSRLYRIMLKVSQSYMEVMRQSFDSARKRDTGGETKLNMVWIL